MFHVTWTNYRDPAANHTPRHDYSATVHLSLRLQDSKLSKVSMLIALWETLSDPPPSKQTNKNSRTL